MAPPREAAPSWEEFAYHLQARRGAALRLFLAVAGLALVGAALLRPSFRATAVLEVLPAPEFTVRGPAGSHEANNSALAMDQIMKAETAILDSDGLHAATLQAVGPAALYPRIFAPEPRGFFGRLLHGATTALLSPWRPTPADPMAARQEQGLRRFESDFTLTPTKDANVVTVSLDNADGTLAAGAVNALLGLYAARRSRLYDDPQTEMVQKTVSRAEAAVRAADRDVADYKRVKGLSDVAQERGLLLRRLDAARQAAQDAGSVHAEQSARMETLGRLLRAEPANVGIFRESDPDTRLQAVNASLQDQRAKLAAAQEKYLDGSRMVGMLRAQIAAEQAEAARLGHDPASSVVRQGRNPNLDQLRLDRARAAAEFSASGARLAAAEAEAGNIQASLDRLDRAETGFLALQRRQLAAQDDFASASRILAERHLSESEDLLRLAHVRVIQPALVPQRPRPIPLLVIAAGIVLGAVAAFARVVADYVLRPVFFTGEGLETATGIPVLSVFQRIGEMEFAE